MSEGSQKKANGFREKGGAWIVAQMLLLTGILASAPLWGAGWSAAPLPARVFGVLCLGLGAWFGLSGKRDLGRNRTAFPKPKTGGALVESGIYALVRHPLYAALIWLGAGVSLVFWSPASGLLALAQAVFFCAKASLEERWLREQFPRYQAYAAKVWRFVPKPGAVAGLSYRDHAQLLAILYIVVWLPLAFHPYSLRDWILENVLVVLAVPVFLAAYRNRLFSRLSHTLIFVFMCLHAVGAHYTYAQVPYNDWWQSLTGRTFNSMFGWERNHFDRAVHFFYGLLMAYPIREIFLRVANVRGFWGYFLPLDLTMSSSLLYELIEWLAAEVLGGDQGQEYLGTQGDIWDAHKDMALASLGALIAMLATAAVNYRCQRDFAREWSDSWKVKRANTDFV